MEAIPGEVKLARQIGECGAGARPLFQPAEVLAIGERRIKLQPTGVVQRKQHPAEQSLHRTAKVSIVDARIRQAKKRLGRFGLGGYGRARCRSCSMHPAEERQDGTDKDVERRHERSQRQNVDDPAHDGPDVLPDALGEQKAQLVSQPAHDLGEEGFFGRTLLELRAVHGFNKFLPPTGWRRDAPPLGVQVRPDGNETVLETLERLAPGNTICRHGVPFHPQA